TCINEPSTIRASLSISFKACKLKGNNKNIENAIAKYEVILLMKEIKNYDN
uniref:Uncharacterized protein n=1 Tax=Cucumis melo TaxID=3656 RepID=A0A9I9EB70_CUCME